MSLTGTGRHLRLGIEIVGAVVACALLSVGCGNPEAPKIEDMRLSYWDALKDGGIWVALEDGGKAPKSPVRIQGTITDNTAVVNPRIKWIGDRGDVGQLGFTECSDGTNEFYECVMDCQGPTVQGYFACDPYFPDTRKLIRGDRFVMTGTQADSENFELEVSVSEAQELREDGEEVETEYRIFRVSSLRGDPGYLWSVYMRTNCGTDSKRQEDDCAGNELSVPCYSLHSGDWLSWDPKDEPCSFQILLKRPDGEGEIGSLNATWRSLVKWNDDSFLKWDATTGFFGRQFQIFDSRDEAGEGEPTYRFVVSAEDVPDQRTKEFRYSEVMVDLLFSPDTAMEAPDLEVGGEDKDLIKTNQPGDNIDGKVLSFSGEVRSLLYRIYNTPPSPEANQQVIASPVFYVDPGRISLEGRFSETIVYVSDWDGDGVVDKPAEGGGSPNNVVEVEAVDVQGNSTRTPVWVAFTPPTKSDAPPELQIQEIFPGVDRKGRGLLPFEEQMRVRARAADDRGQPAFSAWECLCEAEEPRINAERCPCSPITGQPDKPWVRLNAGGQYPWNPWEWIVMKPASEAKESILVLRVKEKVEEEKNKPVAKFTAIPIDLEPSSEQQAYDITVGSAESVGPGVGLVGLQNGYIVPDPNSFVVVATILPRLSALNQITALKNGKPDGSPSYDSDKGTFLWDLEVREGDRVCVGAVSVAGHATLDVLEFADTSEGLLLGVTVTADPGACD
jgi:hypothetical protein